MKLEHLPLSQVIDEFKEWRTSRKKQSRIPDYLWSHVIPLLAEHPRSTVQDALEYHTDSLIST